MGNCVHRCFGIIDRRKRYLRSNYDDPEQNFSIEFENLMEEEPQEEMSRLLTEREQQLLRSKHFSAIAEEQRRTDAEIDSKLKQQEEDLEREEEAFYEAKKEANRIARMNKVKEESAKKQLSNGGSSAWPSKDDADWETTGGDDDFEDFLASVKARSLATRSLVKNGSGDGHSSSSSNPQTMEWDHEAGMSPNRRVQQVTQSEDNTSKTSTASPLHSSDLEWDADFVSADPSDQLQLLNHSNGSKPGSNHR